MKNSNKTDKYVFDHIRQQYVCNRRPEAAGIYSEFFLIHLGDNAVISNIRAALNLGHKYFTSSLTIVAWIAGCTVQIIFW